MAPAGNLKRVFTGKSGQNRKKIFGRVMYASETIQNCKNPTGHIDTLKFVLILRRKWAFYNDALCVDTVLVTGIAHILDSCTIPLASTVLERRKNFVC